VPAGVFLTEPDLNSDWLEKLQQAGLRPYLWLEGLILYIRFLHFDAKVIKISFLDDIQKAWPALALLGLVHGPVTSVNSGPNGCLHKRTPHGKAEVILSARPLKA
jgi:hypothetical protein